MCIRDRVSGDGIIHPVHTTKDWEVPARVPMPVFAADTDLTRSRAARSGARRPAQHAGRQRGSEHDDDASDEHAGIQPFAEKEAAPEDAEERDQEGHRHRDVYKRQAQASAADLQAALLSAQAALVQAYIQLRINDAQQRLLDETVVAYQRSLQITRHRYAAGVAARLDAVSYTHLRCV